MLNKVCFKGYLQSALPPSSFRQATATLPSRAARCQEQTNSPKVVKKKNAYLQLAWQNIRNIFKFPQRQQVPGQQQQRQQGLLAMECSWDKGVSQLVVHVACGYRLQLAIHTQTPAQRRKQHKWKAYANQSYCQAKSVYRCVQLSVIFPVCYVCKRRCKGQSEQRGERVASHVRNKFWALGRNESKLFGRQFFFCPAPTSTSAPAAVVFGHASCYHCCVSKSQWRNKTLTTTSSSSSSNANVYAATGLT